MGTFSNARVHYGLQITGTPTKTNVANDVLVGVGPTTSAITGTTKGYSTSVAIGSAKTAQLAWYANSWTLETPTAQVETATAAGTIGTGGNATVVVTGARITGSPVTVSVAVVNGDTAETWAGKVRTALAANTAISSVYTVGGSTTAITLTETTPFNTNDATLNISLDNGTCTGITTAATSANTTAGVAGSIVTNSTGDSKDFEGAPVELTAVDSFLLQVSSGSLNLSFDNNGTSIFAPPNLVLIQGIGTEEVLTFTALENNTRFTVTVIGTV